MVSLCTSCTTLKVDLSLPITNPFDLFKKNQLNSFRVYLRTQNASYQQLRALWLKKKWLRNVRSKQTVVRTCFSLLVLIPSQVRRVGWTKAVSSNQQLENEQLGPLASQLQRIGSMIQASSKENGPELPPELLSIFKSLVSAYTHLLIFYIIYWRTY